MKYKLIWLIILICLPAFSQTPEQGEKLFNNLQYAEAREVYSALLKKNPRNTLNNYRYARCCYELGELEPAVKHFEAAGNRYPLRNYYLGEIYYKLYRFDEAAGAYSRCLASLKDNNDRAEEIEDKIIRAEAAEKMLSRVEDIAIVDSIIVDKNDFLSYYRFSSESGTLQQKRIALDTLNIQDKITYTTQRQDRVYFSDSIAGRMNLFTSYRLLDGWSPPSLLVHDADSGCNVNYPFLLSDGVTMYFASDGEGSIGGYDIFITKYIPASNAYITPENIGMPFNSPYNDYMMVVDEQNGTGWFASDRCQPEGKVVIYIFVPNESKTIIRSEDKEYIRRAAQLKEFREADAVPIAKPAKNIEPAEEKEEFEFIIHDKLVYTHAGQFKSTEALKAWNELNILKLQLKNMHEQLETLRRQYAAASEAGRPVIAPKILVLEKEIQKQDELLADKAAVVRKEEIKQLKH